MGFRFRRSVNFGPFRITASKSGISTSFGVKGARITKTASGRTRTTVSLPGTGLSYVAEDGRKKKRGGRSVSKSALQQQTQAKPQKKKTGLAIAGIFFLALLITAVISAIFDDPAKPNEVTDVTVVTLTPAPTVEPVRSVLSSPEPTAEPEPTENIPLIESTAEPEPTPTPRVEYTYVLNVKTNVVHHEWCSAVSKMKDSNKREIICTAEELAQKGYKPCSICNP